ncbi:hypothetical protein OPHB3_3480 [Oceanobacillus picturae]|uniref:Uncharacterized protein n=1 Tax=Oceanobacillus picturae TaxID=171693 RepID=W9AMS2_9BACI|nr:hypothetical protein [Oceanobacillus picturae]GAQ19511.1 hypothetical protein OPHB3_3480 [Oceanobacillus picturae]CDO04192.1 hypothetical protein BN988_02741 [Oceanobacillus picturae]
MLQTFLDRIPSLAVFLYATLAFVIPLSTYLLNKKLHDLGDPEWKKLNDKKGR